MEILGALLVFAAVIIAAFDWRWRRIENQLRRIADVLAAHHDGR